MKRSIFGIPLYTFAPAAVLAFLFGLLALGQSFGPTWPAAYNALLFIWLAIAAASGWFCRLLAADKSRSTVGWMWAGAAFGILAILTLIGLSKMEGSGQ